MRADLLPEGFADLEPWVARWALPSEGARYHARCAADYVDLLAFYEATLSRMEAVMDYLANQPNDGSASPEVERLADLGCAFMEVATSVEVWKSPDPMPGRFDWQRFEVLF